MEVRAPQRIASMRDAAQLLGRRDRHVDSRVAAHYVETLQAPVKKLVWFESSAHNPPFEEPERFNETVVAIVGSL